MISLDNSETMEAIVRFAHNVIYSTSTFKQFAMEMMDLIGGPNPIIWTLYKEILSEGIPKEINDKPESIEGRGDDELAADLHRWFKELQREWAARKKEEERKRKEMETMDSVNELYRRIEEFRSAGKFKEMLRLSNIFYYIAPFNALLISLQKPEADFVLSVKDWEYFGRKPSMNGQALIVLVPFGPVQIMFDYADTEQIPECKDSMPDDRDTLLSMWESKIGRNKHGLLSYGESEVWGNLSRNMPRYGIAYHNNLFAKIGFSGYVQKYNNEDLTISVGARDETVDFIVKSEFMINVNYIFRSIPVQFSEAEVSRLTGQNDLF